MTNAYKVFLKTSEEMRLLPSDCQFHTARSELIYQPPAGYVREGLALPSVQPLRLPGWYETGQFHPTVVITNGGITERASRL